MPQNPAPDHVGQALDQVRDAARRYRAATSPQSRGAARETLNKAVVAAVRAGAKQVQVSRISGLSKAQVSRVARGGTSGRTPLPPATHLVDTLPAKDIVTRYRAGETTYQLGRAYGCSQTTIISILKRHGVSRRVGRLIELPVSDEELARRYLEERAELQQLAAELGVKPNLVSRRVAAAGVAVPVGHRRMDLPDAEIVARYKRGEPVQRIARSYGVSWPTIMRRIREDRARASA